MFFRDKQLQYHAKPERPDPLYAKRLQEMLGGQWGEITVMMAYLFQGWNCRGPEKYRDMLLDIGTEEIAHVEMLAIMIARLLEGRRPSRTQEDVSPRTGGRRRDGRLPTCADAVFAGMNPQHADRLGPGRHAHPTASASPGTASSYRQRQPARRLPLEPDGRSAGPAPGRPAFTT